MVSCPLWALAIDIFVGQPIFTGDNGVGVKKEHKDNQMVITDNLTPGPLALLTEICVAPLKVEGRGLMLKSSGASAMGRAVTASLTFIWHCSALIGGFLSGGFFERNVQNRNHQVIEEVALKAARECHLSLLDQCIDCAATEPSKKDNKKHKKSKEGSDGTH